jgi:hypothetical protein
MPLRVFNWDRQQMLLDPKAAMKEGVSVGPEGAAHALIRLLDFLNDVSMQWRVNSELKKLFPEADREIRLWVNSPERRKCYDPFVVGVVIHLIVTIGDAPIGRKRNSSFVALYTGDVGNDFQAAVTNYILTATVVPSAPPNMTPMNSYFWYTPERI